MNIKTVMTSQHLLEIATICDIEVRLDLFKILSNKFSIKYSRASEHISDEIVIALSIN